MTTIHQLRWFPAFLLLGLLSIAAGRVLGFEDPQEAKPTPKKPVEVKTTTPDTEKPEADTKKPAAEADADKKTEEKKTDEKKPDQKAGDKAAKPAKKNGAVNPFNILNRLMPGVIPNIPVATEPDGKPGKDDKNKKPQKERDRVDGRVPYDPKTASWMRRALTHLQNKNWPSAFEMLQKISDHPEDALYRREDGKWVSLRLEVERLRATAPPEALRDYKLQYGPAAQKLLDRALATGAAEDFGRVVAAYFQTDAGLIAAERLGALHFDRGEFALAARIDTLLWQAKASVTSERVWQLRAAFALRQAGDTEIGPQISEALTKGGTDTVRMAGGAIDPAKWLASAAQPPLPSQAVLNDWLAFFGGPRRDGLAAGGEPLLLPRWSVPLTERQPVQKHLNDLQEDLSDQQMTALPQLYPVMVNGKVAFRTLHGVQVVDAASGKPLWQTENDIPVEPMITGQTNGTFDNFGNMRFAGRVWVNGMANFAANGGEYGPLCSLLFRNANFGLISSDGSRLFVIEDPLILSPRMPGQYWWGDPNESTSAASALRAYDLQTGRPLWNLGGDSYGESFEPPLPGYFFFGPPVADNGELLVVGEKESEIRLFAIDPATGKVKWAQMIGLSESGIGADIGRRWWTSQVACSNGLVVCPTTTGWLVAVDRNTRSLVWGHRLTPPQPAKGQEMEQQSMVQQTQLSGRWAAAPPVIIGNKVVVAAPESPNILCVHLGSGKALWQKPRGDLVALCGVFNEKVLVLGRTALTAFNLSDGEQAWTVAITNPAGRGVAVADRYYLPLSNGELWSLQLSDGKLLGKSYVSEGSLGNLALYRGMLLSLNLNGLTTFEQRDAVQAEIARRKAADPRDAWALLREAEMSALNRDFSSALTSLRTIVAETVPTELATRYRALLINSLTAQVRGAFDKQETEAVLDELAKTAETPEDKRHHHRLVAERQVALKDYSGAFDAYLALGKESSAEMVDLDSTSGVRVRSDLWLSGRLADLFSALSPEQRKPLDEKVQALATALANKAQEPAAPQDETKTAGTNENDSRIAELQAFLTLFRWHPAAREAQWKIVELHAARGDFLQAERWLRRLSRDANPAIQARALHRRAELLAQFKLAPDAAAIDADLVERFPASPEAGAVVAAAKPAQSDRPSIGDWSTTELRIDRIGANYTNSYTQEVGGDSVRIPFYRNNRMQIEQQSQRLQVLDGATDSTIWSVPLRSRNTGVDGSLALCDVSDYHMVVMHQGVLHCLSPVDRKVLWTVNPDQRSNQQQYYPGNTQFPVQPMQQTLNMNQGNSARRRSAQQGMSQIGLSNIEYVCRQNRRSVTVLDGLTGEVIWTVEGLRPGTQFFGGEDLLYLRSQQGTVVARRPLDGQAVAVENLQSLLSQASELVDRNLVLLDNPGTPNAKDRSLRLYDPVAKKDLWKIDVPKTSSFSRLDDDVVAIFDTEAGHLHRLDLRNGRQVLLGTLSKEDLKARNELYAFADLDNVYLVVNSRNGNNNYYFSDGLPHIRVSGQIFAFDTRERKLRWKSKVDSNHLMLEQLDASPYLVMASRKYTPGKNGAFPMWSLTMVVLDKFTGAKLIDQQVMPQTSFRNLTVNSAERYVELRGYNERIRLTPVKKTASATPPAAPPDPK